MRLIFNGRVPPAGLNDVAVVVRAIGLRGSLNSWQANALISNMIVALGLLQQYHGIAKIDLTEAHYPREGHTLLTITRDSAADLHIEMTEHPSQPPRSWAVIQNSVVAPASKLLPRWVTATNMRDSSIGLAFTYELPRRPEICTAYNARCIYTLLPTNTATEPWPRMTLNGYGPMAATPAGLVAYVEHAMDGIMARDIVRYRFPDHMYRRRERALENNLDWCTNAAPPRVVVTSNADSIAARGLSLRWSAGRWEVLRGDAVIITGSAPSAEAAAEAAALDLEGGGQTRYYNRVE